MAQQLSRWAHPELWHIFWIPWHSDNQIWCWRFLAPPWKIKRSSSLTFLLVASSLDQMTDDLGKSCFQYPSPILLSTSWGRYFQLRLVVYPTIYRVLYILSGGCGHLKNIPKTPSHLDVLGTALPLGGVSGCRLTRLGLQGNAIEVGRFDFSVLLWNTKSGKVRRAFEIIIPVIYI